jgi:hypothetical protein
MDQQASNLDLSTVEESTAYWMFLDDRDEVPAMSFHVYRQKDSQLANSDTLKINFSLEGDASEDKFEMILFIREGAWNVKFSEWDHPEREIPARLFSSPDEHILRFQFTDKGQQQVFVHLFTH